MDYSLEPLWLSLKLSFITTFILALTGIPLAWMLADMKSKFKPLAETIISLPLVLPPSVLGFYLLIAFSPNNSFGEFLLAWFDIKLVFTLKGLVIASVIYSLPFMVHPVQSAFQNLSPSLKEASYTLGASPVTTFFQVLLPNIRPALLSGLVLTFAHTMGEFGVVLMIGGNIPGITKVASIAIYDEVESMNYAGAHYYASILVAVSSIILFLLFFLNKRFKFQNRYW